MEHHLGSLSSQSGLTLRLTFSALRLWVKRTFFQAYVQVRAKPQRKESHKARQATPPLKADWKAFQLLAQVLHHANLRPVVDAFEFDFVHQGLN